MPTTSSKITLHLRNTTAIHAFITVCTHIQSLFSFTTEQVVWSKSACKQNRPGTQKHPHVQSPSSTSFVYKPVRPPLQRHFIFCMRTLPAAHSSSTASIFASHNFRKFQHTHMHTPYPPGSRATHPYITIDRLPTPHKPAHACGMPLGSSPTHPGHGTVPPKPPVPPRLQDFLYRAAHDSCMHAHCCMSCKAQVWPGTENAEHSTHSTGTQEPTSKLSQRLRAKHSDSAHPGNYSTPRTADLQQEPQSATQPHPATP